LDYPDLPSETRRRRGQLLLYFIEPSQEELCEGRVVEKLVFESLDELGHEQGNLRVLEE